MSAIISAVLIAIPPAFLAGWVLSKALLRASIAGEQPVAGKDAHSASASTLTEGAAAANPVSADPSPDAHDRQLVNKLRQELAAAKTGLQPLQTELQLLKEAGAERQQLVVDLKRKLQLQATLPEETPATGTARHRQLLQLMKDRLETGEQRIAELTDELSRAENKGRRTAERFLNWRQKMKPLAKQYRQQRAMLKELREELRLRDMRQRDQQESLAKAQAQRVAAIAEATTMAASVPEASSASPVSECAAANAGLTKAEVPALSVAEKTVESPVDQPQSGPEAPVAMLAPKRADAKDADAAVPASVAASGDEEREDLQALRGVGPALHKKLNAQGVYRLKQLAVMDGDEMLRLGKSLGVSHKAILKQDWVSQARALLQMTDLSQRQSSEHAEATS